LCLSSSLYDLVGFCKAEGSYPNGDRHKAPAHPHILPLSLQDGGGVSGHSLIRLSNIIRMVNVLHSLIRLSNIIRETVSLEGIVRRMDCQGA